MPKAWAFWASSVFPILVCHLFNPEALTFRFKQIPRTNEILAESIVIGYLVTRLQRTNGIVGDGGPRLIPILFIALLVATGAAAVVYGVATVPIGSIFTGKLLQTTNNSDIVGSPRTQFCENQTSTTG